MQISRTKSPEAELVLCELNHRFLNTLQIMGSLTSLHSGRSAEKQLELLRGCICALGRVHGILAAAEVPTFAVASEDICAALVAAFRRSATFSFVTDEEPADQALRRDLLLVLSELATNALKHAGEGRLEVKVGLERRSGCWRLEVVSSTRGRRGWPRIAGALARWLGGDLSVDADDGFAVAATLPDPMSDERVARLARAA